MDRLSIDKSDPDGVPMIVGDSWPPSFGVFVSIGPISVKEVVVSEFGGDSDLDSSTASFGFNIGVDVREFCRVIRRLWRVAKLKNFF